MNRWKENTSIVQADTTSSFDTSFGGMFMFNPELNILGMRVDLARMAELANFPSVN